MSILLHEELINLLKHLTGIKGPPAFPIVGTLFSEIGRDGRELEKYYLKNYGEVSDPCSFESSSMDLFNHFDTNL